MRKMAWLCATMFAWAGLNAHAQQVYYAEGKDYTVLEKVIDNGQSPKVIEFFWYGCPHCYAAEPAVKNWLEHKDANIMFEKVPAPSGAWKTGAQLFYTLQVLNVDLDDAVFEEAQRNIAIVRNPKAAAEFVVKKASISEEDFDKAWNSFAVAQKLKRAEALFEESGFEGVPSFLVNGQYASQMNEKPSAFFKKLEFLAVMKAEQKTAKQAEEVKAEAAPVSQ